MENQKQTIDNLMNAMFDYLSSVDRSEATIYRYYSRWKKVKKFMMDNKIKYFDADVGKAYVTSLLGDYDYNILSYNEKRLVSETEIFSIFQKTGYIKLGQRKPQPKVFIGDIGRTITDFIGHRGNTLRLSKKTIQDYGIYLYSFNCHLNSIGLKYISDIKASDILSYIGQMDLYGPAKKHFALNMLKIFFRYLYEHSILSVDYSRIIPKDNYRNQPRLPSTFTDSEIDTLLKSVDRGSPRGKRDYAILLLATKLGLRASDICELRFENIIWERNVITFNQYKTGKGLELPLLPEIGNAIIDYLRHGRPVSRDSNCFIQVQAPYERIHTYDLGNMVRRYITLSGINYSNRKHGPHAFRHCFASALLKANVPLPIISEALGHEDMASSMMYLRIDINSLRKCALEVPPVPSSFYEQKGGYRYV